MQFHYGGTTHDVRLERRADGYRAIIDGASFDFTVLDAQPGVLTLQLAAETDSGRPVIYWGTEGETRWFSTGGCTYRLDPPPRPHRRGRAGPESAAATELRAPMPAQVRGAPVAEGDEVAAGQTLMLLEAMKMEIRIQAPGPARVARLLVREGDTVERDQVVVELAGIME